MTLKSIVVFLLVLSLAGTAGAAAQDPFAAAIEHINSGDWAAGARLLEECAAQRPKDAVVRLTAGVALATLKRYPQAVEHFEAAARLVPDSALPLLLLDAARSDMAAGGRRAVESGRAVSKIASLSADPAVDLLARSLAAYPRNAVTYCLLGDIHQLAGRREQACEAYAKASELSPNWAKPLFNLGLARLQDDPVSAQHALERSIEIDPSSLRSYLWLGDAYLRQGRAEDAVRAYEKAAKDPALQAEARIRVGNARLRTGDYEGALKEFQAAASEAPRDPRALAGQAQALQKMGRPKDAERVYLQAASRASPESQAVLQNHIGLAQRQQGRFADAAGNFQEAFDLAPNIATADALADAQQKAGTLQAGIAQYEARLNSSPNDLPAMLYLLAAYKRSGNAAGAAKMASRLVRADPSNAPAYYADLGAAQAALGNTDSAVDAYVLGLEFGGPLTWSSTAGSAARCGVLGMLEARFAAAFDRRPDRRAGDILLELRSALQDRAGEAAVAGKLVELYPDDSGLWLRLGAAREQTGDIQGARAAYLRVVAYGDPRAVSLAQERLDAIKSR